MKRFYLHANSQGPVIMPEPSPCITDLYAMLDRVRFYPRPRYLPEEAQQVVDWLNGQDRPIRGMVSRGDDPFYYGEPLTADGVLLQDFPSLPSGM